MDKIEDHVQAFLTTESKALSETTNPIGSTMRKLSNQLVSRIFAVMKTDYGTAFASQFTTVEMLEAAKKRWAHVLGHLSRDEIYYGLNAMGRDFVQYPPNLQQFKAICERKKPRKPVHASHVPWKKEAVERAPESRRVNEVDKIKQILPNANIGGQYEENDNPEQ